jgi:hypothetical protein
VLASFVAIGGLVVLNCGASSVSNSAVPDLGQPSSTPLDPFAQPPRYRDIPATTYPDSWREVRFQAPPARMASTHAEGPAGTLRVTPRVGIGPLAVHVSWHVPDGHGVATLTATQTDLEPPMVVCRMARDTQGRAETLQARWTLPPGLYDVSGCVRGRCVRQSVAVS